jgi:hypothetical protein
MGFSWTTTSVPLPLGISLLTLTMLR